VNNDQRIKALMLVGLMLMLVAITRKGILPGIDEIDRSLFLNPVQSRIYDPPFRTRVGDNNYIIQPLFQYELRGMVVSYHNGNAWWDIYHHGLWQDFINIKDLCVVWGDNLATGVYRDMTYDSDNWTCYATTADTRSSGMFRPNQLSNNHLLNNNEDIQDTIMNVSLGDQIYLKGQLVNYANPATNFRRGTSISRNDTGNGACETIFVEDFKVIKENNPGWRTAYLIAKLMVIASLVLLVCNYLFGGVTDFLDG
jgi:hypothetical protein